jgi:hypothetical protein
LFAEFEKEVPGLKSFFDDVIDGNNDYDISKELAAIGIEFQEETYINAPRNPLNDSLNDITKKDGVLAAMSKQKVLSVGPNEWAGLQKGDKVSLKAYYDAFKPEGVFVKEGETVNYKITRDKKEISLPIKVVYAMQPTNDYLAPVANPTEQQKLYWTKYMGQ